MSAERGWIGEEPPPKRERTPPSHAYKWYKMMGAAELLPETPARRKRDPGETEEAMSAERGWIGDPQPPKEWHDSRYSRQADKIRREDEKRRRAEEAKNLKPSEK